MIVAAGFIGGAVWGALVARARGGNRLDMAQYAAGYAIGCAVLGLFATLVLERLL